MHAFRVGSTVQDLCRPCGMVRRHTVIVADDAVRRVMCDYCGSRHNYRGGERAARRLAAVGTGERRSGPDHGTPLPLVSERERSAEPMGHDEAGGTTEDLELLLRRIIREEAGVTPVAPAEKWRGGMLVLRPGREGLQEKTLPIETLFSKIVMVRNRLRTLEQQVNAADLPGDVKLKLQGYVTACYGSLTTFNVLFADDEDRFRGSGGGD